uniref:Uncharacterized protein n=1 Tax=Proboscia inermis TaxID=420281 RepID=A0A7S0GGA7_9STRA|mmetsp:Transcript_45901/g.46371  ORF Transcript_45901/g.46371 Transcript_45901/m.46371 type:complete len:167 (+) Transcript_45901:56-556(+)
MFTRIANKMLILAIILINEASFSLAYENGYGNELSSCSQNGMALTGFTRDGFCTDQNDDTGSHHICINVSTSTGGNFCDVTGQSDWCSSEMPCHQNEKELCPVQNWCVCQWAFASYIAEAGGCDEIQDIVCESINREAVAAYKKNSGTAKMDNALSCLVKRCGFEV